MLFSIRSECNLSVCLGVAVGAQSPRRAESRAPGLCFSLSQVCCEQTRGGAVAGWSGGRLERRGRPGRTVRRPAPSRPCHVAAQARRALPRGQRSAGPGRAAMNFLRGVMGGPSAGPQPSGADTVSGAAAGGGAGRGRAGAAARPGWCPGPRAAGWRGEGAALPCS